MCTNGTEVTCELPSLPNPTTHKGWPHHRCLRPILFSKSDVGSFTSHKNNSVKVPWDGTSVFSSLSEKTRKSNHLNVITKAAHSPQLDPECWSGRGLNQRPPPRQTDALPTKLARRRFSSKFPSDYHSSSETQRWSVGPKEKARRNFSSTGGKALRYRLSPDHFQTVKRRLAPDWAQKMLCIIVPNLLTASPLSSFREFVHDGYCLDHGLSGSCTKEMHAVRKLSVWYN